MKYTKNLKLPIFDNPSEDLFKVSDWNEANENIESTVTEVKDWKDSMVSADPIAEIIDARCGEKILGDKIRKIDNEINLSNENITNINSQLEDKVKYSDIDVTKLKHIYGGKLNGEDDSDSLKRYISQEKYTKIPNCKISILSPIVFENINDLVINCDETTFTTKSNVTMFTFINCNNIKILNGKFDMSSQGGDNIDNTKNFIAKFKNCSNIEIVNNEMFNGCQGIHFENCTNILFEKNKMYNFKWWNCFFGDNKGGYVKECVIRNNECYQNADGIKLSGVLENVIIYNNKCYKNRRDGIDFAGHSVNNINIFNNILEYNEMNGIEFKTLEQTIYPVDSAIDPSTLQFRYVFIHDNEVLYNKQKGINTEYRSEIIKQTVGFYNIYNNNILGVKVNSGTENIGIDVYKFADSNGLNIYNNIIDGAHLNFGIRLRDTNEINIYNNTLHAKTNVIYINRVDINVRDISITNNKITTDSNYCVRSQCEITNITIANNEINWADNAYRILLEQATNGLSMYNNIIYNYNNSTIPTGRATVGEVAYSNNPTTSKCTHWICAYGGVNPTWKAIGVFE